METMVSSDNLYSRTLDALDEAGNLRTLSQAEHQGKWIWKEGKRMLNLSSNDYWLPTLRCVTSLCVRFRNVIFCSRRRRRAC